MVVLRQEIEELFLRDAEATESLATALAPILRLGDVMALSGGLGAGKTTFARALIRRLAGNPALEVPSPTFTLVQTYGEAPIPVSHFDLYRLAGGAELDELGFDDAVAAGIALVEWPERAPGRLVGALGIAFAMAGSGRTAVLAGNAAWRERLSGVRLL